MHVKMTKLELGEV